ncbi:unnamed protein product [Rotaria magnacalcarata]|nr:unnamed protein product [Rotaria magnacalcarata]CAF2029726.1 unnamed protein product [Rotaria magnacalcarata]CAF2149817.1 unnamed protein product [Rotaria magnacalcarata]CAF3797614.1 unnamed protein product [Rotaria magnacalcarata]
MTSNSDISTDENKSLSVTQQYGFSLDNLFDMARQFLKEKQGSRAIQLKYDEKLRFVALSKQATIGKWEASHTENVGLLDVVGNDRKQSWITLGDMSKEQAKEEFIKLLLERCPMFQHHLEAHHVENEEKDRLKKEDEARRTLEQEAQRVRQHELEQVSHLEEQNKKREEFQRKQIQEALNQQTYPQFKTYAEQQFKDNRQAQDELIRQLQEQHFQQYMQQVYQQQLNHQQQQQQQQQQQRRIKTNMEQQSTNLPSSATLLPNNQMPPLGPAPTQLPPVVHPPPQSLTNGSKSLEETRTESAVPIQNQFESLSLNSPLQPSARSDLSQSKFPSVQINNELSGSQQSVDDNPIDNEAAMNPIGDLSLSSDDGTREYPNLAPASMWTRKDIKEFKDAVRKEKDAVIKIGSGETVTVRVPTHEDGRCIFWEFATDYYDIGFGLYFEWSQVQSNTVTVHVSDSSEEEEEDGEDGSNQEKKDIEKGSRSSNKPPKPYQDEIVPIFRRDSHEEIYAGSHPYPGNGVYLLKFDNSYSLWRSKTLYYRVYYSR